MTNNNNDSIILVRKTNSENDSDKKTVEIIVDKSYEKTLNDIKKELFCLCENDGLDDDDFEIVGSRNIHFDAHYSLDDYCSYVLYKNRYAKYFDALMSHVDYSLDDFECIIDNYVGTYKSDDDFCYSKYCDAMNDDYAMRYASYFNFDSFKADLFRYDYRVVDDAKNNCVHVFQRQT